MTHRHIGAHYAVYRTTGISTQRRCRYNPKRLAIFRCCAVLYSHLVLKCRTAICRDHTHLCRPARLWTNPAQSLPAPPQGKSRLLQSVCIAQRFGDYCAEQLFTHHRIISGRRWAWLCILDNIDTVSPSFIRGHCESQRPFPLSLLCAHY